MAKMGLDFGLNANGKFCKRNFRWLFKIPEVCADDSPGANALPPQKSARPSVQFKESNAKHLIEDVYYPAKPDWKPISVVLYDLNMGKHPVFKWLKQLYDVNKGEFYEPNRNKFIKEARLEMLSGCGEVLETWIYEDAWPQNIDFAALDMNDNGITVCEFTMRYVRAYIQEK